MEVAFPGTLRRSSHPFPRLFLLGLFMRRVLLFGCVLVVCACSPLRNLHWGAQPYPNPVLVTSQDPDALWEKLVVIINDYFRITRESRPRVVEGIATEGFLETAPEVSSTWLEPWRGDSVGLRQRTESTLQSIRRRAEVRVMPAERGYLVEVFVYKELEDLADNSLATLGDATFDSTGTLEGVEDPKADRPRTAGWIPLGRDPKLEQVILSRLVEH